MTYKLYVPVGSGQLNCEKQRPLIIKKLKKAKAETVFLVPDMRKFTYGSDEVAEKELNDILLKLVPDWRDQPADYRKLDEARARIGDLIEKLKADTGK